MMNEEIALAETIHKVRIHRAIKSIAIADDLKIYLDTLNMLHNEHIALLRKQKAFLEGDNGKS